MYLVCLFVHFCLPACIAFTSRAGVWVFKALFSAEKTEQCTEAWALEPDSLELNPGSSP